MIERSAITGVVLAGGRGMRMGGVDKGLQDFRGDPLVMHAITRLGPQVAALMINANQNIERYEAFGHPVYSDVLDGFPGPLAGFLTGIEHTTTPWIATAPCDTPFFPRDLVMRLAEAASAMDAPIAIAQGPEDSGELRMQPCFCLLHMSLLESLVQYTRTGGRKVEAWTALHKRAVVPFDKPGDDPHAFINVNTIAELQRLESP